MDIKESVKKIGVYFYILVLTLVAGATIFSSNFLAENTVKNSFNQLLKASETSNQEIYIAVNGSDSSGNGSFDNPFASVEKAQAFVGPGTRVLFRGGTYKRTLKISKGSGTESQPVVYTTYNNEKVIIDGTGLQIAENDALVNLNQVNNIQFIGFEVVNSSGRGINAYNSNNILIKNNIVHETMFKAIGGSGSNITIDGNETYNAAMVNAKGVMGTHGWPQVISSAKKPDGSASTNFNITNNYIHDSWGEGIDLIALDGGIISGNRIRDTFSVLLYLDNAKNILIDGNYLSAYDPDYYRDGYPARAIMISSENCCSTNPSFNLDNITISNNLIVNTKSAIRYWQGELKKPYSNMKIYYNTLISSIKEPTIYFDSTTTTNNELKNNIIFGSIAFPDSANWTILSNNWLSGKPSADRSTTSFSSDPMFVNPEPNGPADGYRLKPNSSSVGKGEPVSTVTDYFKSIRNINNTTVGFYEMVSTASEPTATPVTAISPTPTQKIASPTKIPTIVVPSPTLSAPTVMSSSTPMPTPTPFILPTTPPQANNPPNIDYISPEIIIDVSTKYYYLTTIKVTAYDFSNIHEILVYFDDSTSPNRSCKHRSTCTFYWFGAKPGVHTVRAKVYDESKERNWRETSFTFIK